MKSFLKQFSIPILAIIFICAGCNQNESLIGDFSPNGIENFNISILESVDEVLPCLASFPLCAGQNNTYGSVLISNDEDYIYVHYESTVIIEELHLWVGSSYEDAPGKNNPKLGHFPYTAENVNEYSYTFVIPIDEIEADEDACYDVIAHAAFEDGETGYASDDCPTTERFWKNWAQYVDYCLLDPCVGGIEECETGYAYDDELAECFIDIQGIQGNRWGWVIGPLEEGVHTFPVYAAAGQCNLNNGENVGDAIVTISGNSVSVAFDIDDPFELNEWHFNASCELVPESIANGQLNCNDGTCEVECQDGIYVIVHTVTCIPSDDNSNLKVSSKTKKGR